MTAPENWRTLGVIPARGGSKGVTRKNVRLLDGRPLISYTIDAARRSDLLTELVVSTEDPEIAAIADEHGVSVVDRPFELAGDLTPMAPVVQHALTAVESRTGLSFDCVFTLQVTTPFRTPNDIDGAIEALRTSGAESVVGVVRLRDAHPARAKRLVDGRLSDFCVPEDEYSRPAGFGARVPPERGGLRHPP